MPLDTGGLSELEFRTDVVPAPIPAESPKATLASGANIGAALRAIREHSNRSLEEVAAATRVRRAYLAAIEEMRLDALPSRPFTIGYVRAYAQALGQDGEAAVRRFRLDAPDPDGGLREPVGVEHGRDPRLIIVASAGAIIVVAIVIWNVVQRALNHDAPRPPPVADSALVTDGPATPDPTVTLGQPLPPPVESTTPAPYETPGLQAAAAAREAAAAGVAPPPAVIAAKPAPIVLPATFTPAGAIYGPPAQSASSIIIQARRSGSIIVKRADGSVQFARFLAAGEAYRVPAEPVTIEALDADVFQAFSGGQSKGLLPKGPIAAAKLAS